MYTTEKLPAARSFPKSATVVLPAVQIVCESEYLSLPKYTFFHKSCNDATNTRYKKTTKQKVIRIKKCVRQKPCTMHQTPSLAVNISRRHRWFWRLGPSLMTKLHMQKYVIIGICCVLASMSSSSSYIVTHSISRFVHSSVTFFWKVIIVCKFTFSILLIK